MRIVNLHHCAFVPMFRKLGHEVLSIGTTPDCDVTLSEPLSHKRFLELLAERSMRPDLVFWCDACQLPWIFGLESLPAVVIGYSVDQYLHPWHVPFSAGFDAVFVAQKDYLDLFTSPHYARPAAWMPLFCDPARCAAPEHERDIPISFVGTVHGTANPERAGFLDAFHKRAPLVVTSGAYAPVYGRSRIVLNQSAAGEVNFRVFEAMGCGAALLTEETGNGLRELFTPGEDVLVYRRGDPADAARQALAALADPPRLAALTASGRRKTLAGHTVATRARLVLDTARHLAGTGAVGRRLAAIDRIRTEVDKAYLFLATDDRLPLPEAERQFFLDLAQRKV